MNYDFNIGLYYNLVEHFNLTETAWMLVLPILFTVLAIFVGYLLGSINAAIIVSRVFYHDDIRKHGSGNAGMTNVLRTYGAKAGLITLLGDIGKAVLAVIFGGFLLGFEYLAGISLGMGGYIGAISVVVGHVFPIFYGFKGGKGVLATAASVLVLSPPVFLILILVFALIFWPSKYISLGSISAAVLLPVAFNGYISFVFGGMPAPMWVSVVTIAIAILIVWCHRENITRIANRTERKFSIGKKKPISGESEKDIGENEE